MPNRSTSDGQSGGVGYGQSYNMAPEWLQDMLQARMGNQSGTFEDVSDVWNTYQPQISQRWGQDSFYNPAFMRGGQRDFSSYDPFEQQQGKTTRNFGRQYGDDKVKAYQTWQYDLDPFTNQKTNYNQTNNRGYNASFGYSQEQQQMMKDSAKALGLNPDSVGQNNYSNRQRQMINDYNKWASWSPS